MADVMDILGEQPFRVNSYRRSARVIGEHTDVLRAQVELGKVEDRLRGLEDLRRPVRARLNETLGRPVAAPIAAPVSPLPEPLAFDAAALVEGLDGTIRDL